jgi:hypothetical protein
LTAAHAKATHRSRQSGHSGHSSHGHAARRRGPRFIAARAILVLAAVALTAGTSTVATSGAYFTAGKVTTGNTATAATVDIGGLGSDAIPNETLAVSNILPLTDADAGDNAKGSFLAVNVRNVGTTPIDWSVDLLNATSTPSDFVGLLRVRVSLDNGASYGGTQNLTSITQITGLSLAAPTQAVPSVVRIKLRVWLDKSAANTAQNAVATFSTQTKAIQSGVAMSTSGVTYPQ